jgi:CheY-like chemotaxis protein
MTTWMLLEDEPDLFDMILTMVGMLGIGGIGFSTGGDAVEWIEKVEAGDFQGELPDLALLDIRMPDDINGPMVGARIGKSPVLKDVVVVLMTAYKLSPSQEEDVIKEAGASLLIRKPLPRIDELTYILNGLIEERKKS